MAGKVCFCMFLFMEMVYSNGMTHGDLLKSIEEFMFKMVENWYMLILGNPLFGFFWRSDSRGLHFL